MKKVTKSEPKTELNAQDISHKSVLVREVVEYLNIKPHGVYLDATFGGGGHTRAILEHEPTCRVVALDWDEVSIEKHLDQLQEQYPDRVTFLWGNFANLYKVLKKAKIGPLDGILADFGTSQMQIFARPGFSLYRDAALDMRMSPPHQKVTAAHVVNKESAYKLQEIFFQLGEERHARKIAQAIVQERTKKPIETTTQLADLIERVVKPDLKRRIHPATRVFQALRMYVNRELDNILAFLPAAIDALDEDGRLVCISFHSLEDRLVKTFLREQEQEGTVRVVTKSVVVASQEEVNANPSSRSAKLRAAARASRGAVRVTNAKRRTALGR